MRLAEYDADFASRLQPHNEIGPAAVREGRPQTAGGDDIEVVGRVAAAEQQRHATHVDKACMRGAPIERRHVKAGEQWGLLERLNGVHGAAVQSTKYPTRHPLGAS